MHERAPNARRLGCRTAQARHEAAAVYDAAVQPVATCVPRDEKAASLTTRIMCGLVLLHACGAMGLVRMARTQRRAPLGCHAFTHYLHEHSAWFCRVRRLLLLQAAASSVVIAGGHNRHARDRDVARPGGYRSSTERASPSPPTRLPSGCRGSARQIGERCVSGPMACMPSAWPHRSPRARARPRLVVARRRHAHRRLVQRVAR